MKEEIVDDDEISKIVSELKLITKEDTSFEELKKEFPDGIRNLEEGLKLLCIWKWSQNFKNTISW